MSYAISPKATDTTDGTAAGDAARRGRLRILDVVLTPAATRLGGVFIATGPFVAGGDTASGEVDLAVALLFDGPRRQLAEKAASAAAEAAGLTMRIERTPECGSEIPVVHMVFGDRRSILDGRRSIRPCWTRIGSADRIGRTL